MKKYGLGLLWIAGAAVHAGCLVPSFKAVYETTVSGLSVGNVTQTFHVSADKRYAFHSVAHSGISIFQDTVRENSVGRVTDAGLKPLQYSMVNDKLRQHVTVTFNWPKGVAHSVSHHKGKVSDQTIQLKADAQDFLSNQVQFQRQLRQHPHLKTLSLQLIHKGGLQDYVYNRVKTENVKTPLGVFHAVLFERHSAVGLTQLWFSTDKDAGVLVQLHQTVKNSVSLTMRIKRFQLSSPSYCA